MHSDEFRARHGFKGPYRHGFTRHTISLSVVKLGVRKPCDLTENLSMYEPLEAA
ncbi:hypothetical protein BDR04DRAFT_1093939 [Suillus decipiens]|nr:hypothetical protein BDR04DRAFT_1093939 [Suillus decipiens]